MKISYDPEVDALSIIFRETTVTTKPLGEGISVEYDRSGRLVGIEVLDVVKRFGNTESFHQVIVEGIGPASASRRGHMVVAENKAAYGTRKATRKGRH
jgi:uncharacterized protein YuzE